MDSLLVQKNIAKTKTPAKPAPFLLCIISIVLYLAFLTFFVQGFPAMDPVYTQPFSDSEFFLTFAFVFILGVNVLLLGYRYFGIGPNWVMATICLLLFLSDLLAIITFPSSYFSSATSVYHLTEINRIRYLFTWFATCVGLYMIFAVIPKMAINSRQWDFLFGLGVIAALFAIIYSYFAEADIYVNMFNPDVDINVYQVPLSFTNNRNTYGTLLLIGVIGAVYLNSRSHHWWYFLLALFIYINELFVLSKTTIIASTILYSGYLIWLYFTAARRHAIIANAVLILFISSFLATLLIHNTGAIPALASFQKFINSVLYTLQEVGTDTVESRIVLWNIQFSAIYSDPMYIIFGFGDHNYEPLLGVLFGKGETLGYAHMGILDVFGRLGVVGIIAYVAGIIYAIILMVNGFGKKRRITFVYLLSLIVFLIHGSMESTNFLSLEPTSLAFLLAVFLPLLTDDANDKRPEVIDYYARLYSGGRYKNIKTHFSSLDVYQLSLFILTPIASILVGLGPIVSGVMGTCIFDNPNSVAALIILWAMAPIALAATFSLIRVKRVFGIVLFSLFSVLSIIVLIVGITINNISVPVVSGLFFGIMVLLSLLPNHGTSKKQLIKKFVFSFAIMLALFLVTFGFEKYVSADIRPSNETRYILPITILMSASFFHVIMFGLGVSSYVAPSMLSHIFGFERSFFIRRYSGDTKAEAKEKLFFGSSRRKKRNK